MKLNCPNCSKTFELDSKSTFKPFCSERCKLIDLGEWASGSHQIKGESLKPNLTGQIDEFDLDEQLGLLTEQSFFKE